MHTRFACLALILAALVAPAIHAAEAKPFGVDIGHATLADVRQVVGTRTALHPDGLSAVTRGPMLAGNGQGLGTPDVEGVRFIFGPHGTLQAVTIRLPNGGMGYPLFKRYRNLLAEHYRKVADREAFVGEQYARFIANNAVITLESPQMAFNMNLIYASPKAETEMHHYEAVLVARRRAAEAKGL
ncbi:conserved hypothetical protein, secreted [mine drainage metagenome]|uniref:Uncharacterized protein n=1 Tax=mine drainage metagenome TaxID=410659 RepID=T1B0P8_9ZZZZ